MAILPILRYPDPRLATIAKDVPQVDALGKPGRGQQQGRDELAGAAGIQAHRAASQAAGGHGERQFPGPADVGAQCVQGAQQRSHRTIRRARIAEEKGEVTADVVSASKLSAAQTKALVATLKAKIGSIEAANGGVLFLDEIGDLPKDLQVNLLRVLQERTITRLGSTQAIPVDFRLVAATHVDLQEAIRSGQFREDLYYRLNVIQLQLPP